VTRFPDFESENTIKMTKNLDVAILGAGPYGLAVGAHLNHITGLDVQAFGNPMEFWKAQMPAGMFLRSPWSASHISDPRLKFDFNSYRNQIGKAIPAPIPLDTFVGYGLWFQQNAVPNLIQQKVTTIRRGSLGFELTLETGETWHARRVIIAGGIGPFARRPEVFNGLYPQFVSHCSDGRDVNRLKASASLS
jgi:cation diffusion facilitator CzcD-associated flavoprotein CzcO